MMIPLHQAMLLIAEEGLGLDTSSYPPGLDPARRPSSPLPRGSADPHNEVLKVYIKARRMLHELAITGDIPCVYFKDGRSHSVTPEDLEKGYWFSPDDNTLVDRNGIEPTLYGVRIDQEALRAKLMEPKRWRADHAELCRAYEAECARQGGPPRPDGPEGWQSQAGLARWVQTQESMSFQNAKRYAVELLALGGSQLS